MRRSSSSSAAGLRSNTAIVPVVAALLVATAAPPARGAEDKQTAEAPTLRPGALSGRYGPIRRQLDALSCAPGERCPWRSPAVATTRAWTGASPGQRRRDASRHPPEPVAQISSSPPRYPSPVKFLLISAAVLTLVVVALSIRNGDEWFG